MVKMNATPNALGVFLRARRDLVTPEQAGIHDHGARRVPGLRREEVAMLAGISADYYLRLERGKNRNPSGQVLKSLARVLHLDGALTTHLYSLASHADAAPRREAGSTTPPASIAKLLDSLPQPAFIEGPYFEVLAANALARALLPRLAVGRNQLLDLFTNPAEQALYPDWQDMTECLIANLRQTMGGDVDDPRAAELIDELAVTSAYFRELWARHEVRSQQGTPARINHPLVGPMTLHRERMAIDGVPGQTMVVFHAERDSADADALARLGSARQPHLVV